MEGTGPPGVLHILGQKGLCQWQGVADVILSTGVAGQEVSPRLPAGGAEDVAVEAALERGARGGHLADHTAEEGGRHPARLQATTLILQVKDLGEAWSRQGGSFITRSWLPRAAEDPSPSPCTSARGGRLDSGALHTSCHTGGFS